MKRNSERKSIVDEKIISKMAQKFQHLNENWELKTMIEMNENDFENYIENEKKLNGLFNFIYIYIKKN